MSDIEVIEKFVSSWSDQEEHPKATDQEIKKAESLLGFSLPAAYVEMVTRFGSVYCPDLLDAIVAVEADLPDVQNFDLPDDVIKNIRAYSGMGMPEGFVCFASDCMGNMFCFKAEECEGEGEPGIWFFDHEFCEIEKVTHNFIEWLEAYVQLATVNK
ncbi:SMI1/KNR4 family protein [Vreelandella venusta]|uniref:SMI1/KNR4 family protein n=1 Tax=Vreelandella venusta TaxID=44935 RepID=UPI003F67705D